MIKKETYFNKIKLSGIYFLGNIFNKAISFLMIPIYIRFLTTQEYGLYNTYTAYLSIFVNIIGLAFDYSIRNAFIDFKEDIEGYISSVFTFSILLFPMISGLILVVNYLIFKQESILITMLLFHSLFIFINNCILVKYMMNGDYKKRILNLILPNVFISIGAIILLIRIQENKYWGIIGSQIFIMACLSIYHIVSQLYKGRKFYQSHYWLYALKISPPLIFHGLANMLLANSDRILLSNLRSHSETGIYSLSYSLGMILIAFTSAVENVWVPWFIAKMEDNDKKTINFYVIPYMGVVLAFVVGLMMIGPEILKVMAPKEYWDGVKIISPVAASCFMMFLYSISIHLELYYKSSKRIAVNTFIVSALNVILNMIFIPKFGIVAAAYTTLFSYFVLFILHRNYAHKLDDELFPKTMYIVPLLIIILFSIIAFYFAYSIMIRWSLAIIYVCISIGYLYKKMYNSKI